MNSSMIGKIEKAHRYAREPERIQIQAMESTFHGTHDDYTIRLQDGRWECTCHTFESNMLGTCSHIMALQLMLGAMLADDVRYGAESAEPVAASAD